jgi:uncharacterized 2Fe-2S/4Fe-4S cluster protein (DUF4445 family)
MSEKQNYHIVFEPVGKRISIGSDETILDAARAAGIDLESVCGGGGTCGFCRIRLIKGDLTKFTSSELDYINQSDRKVGIRLACQVHPLSDAIIDIPAQSLTALQRTQVEGVESDFKTDPPVFPIALQLKKPTLKDLDSDESRLRYSLLYSGYPNVLIPLGILKSASEVLRENEWKVKAAVHCSDHGISIGGLIARKEHLCGIAVDIGTTKLAMYLVDMETRQTLVKMGQMNPQIPYGEDVVSRIAYCNKHQEGRKVLQSTLINTLNAMIEECCTIAGINRDCVVEFVAVGNTVMHHIFCGLPVRQLGESPYLPAVSAALEFQAEQVGLKISPGAHVYLPPNIAGYVGADHISMLLATEAWKAHKITIALDIGTNTEISLISGDQHFSCSCASGPAFEGAHISAGMRASKGAIERFKILGEENHIKVIEDSKPTGICGSGILDVVAEMVHHHVVDTRGSLSKLDKRVSSNGFLICDERSSGLNQPIYITREDVNQIQLAKAAIQVGWGILLEKAKLKNEDIDTFIIAGAFGSYLDVESGIRIGMLPNIPVNKFQQVGNAAGMGARQLLLSRHKRKDAQKVSDRISYVELTTYKKFMERYLDALYFKQLTI